jgi:hypothetical protein
MSPTVIMAVIAVVFREVFKAADVANFKLLTLFVLYFREIEKCFFFITPANHVGLFFFNSNVDDTRIFVKILYRFAISCLASSVFFSCQYINS